MNPENTTLLVPMQIEAIMLPAKRQTAYGNVVKNYNAILLNPAGDDLESRPMSMRNTPFENGIHLHFTLPEALCHGTQQEKGNVVYPAVPNRYLIVRISVMKEGKTSIPAVKTWIIESDSLSQKRDARNQYSLGFPAFGDIRHPVRLMGMCREFEGVLTSGSEHLEQLTAVAGGDPYYASYYPGCRNVFGFLDDTVTKPDTREGKATKDNPAELTYLVYGWYEKNPTRDTDGDPLGEIKTWEECERILGWTSGHKEKDIPSHTAVHGTLSGLKWMGMNEIYESGVPDQGNIPKIAVGNSSEEAMAAFSSFCAKNQKAERLIHSLMNQSLDEWETQNGILNVEKKNHDSRFFPRESTGLFSVTGEGGEMHNTRESVNALQGFQKLMHQKEQKIEAICQEIWEIWLGYASDMALEEKAKKLLDEKLLTLKQLQRDTLILSEDIETHQKRLQKVINQDQQLVMEPDGRFFTPNNPVILFDGAGRNSALENRKTVLTGGKEEPFLFCRLEEDIIIARTIAMPELLKDKTIDLAGEEFLGSLLSKELPFPVQALALESLLLSEGTSRYLGEMVSKKSGLPEDKLPYVARQIVLKAGQDQKKGTAPAPLSLAFFIPGWNPLLLDWKVHFYPDPELLEGKFTFKNWKLGDIDYNYQGEAIQKKVSYEYNGRTILTPHVSEQLYGLARNYLDLDLKKEQRGNAGYHVLSQSLDGFNHQFHMRYPRIQYPPLAFEGMDPEVVQKTAYATNGAETLAAAATGGFFPVRAGFLNLSSFLVIDMFGRALRYDPDVVITPENMRPDSKPYQNMVMLPPRILQPSRLRTRFPSEQSELSCLLQEDYSMICGFLWPNFIESSLQVYNALGELQGTLQVVYNLETGLPQMQWRNAPGTRYLQSGYPKDMDPMLKKVMESMRIYSQQRDKKVLFDFLTMLDDCFWNMNLITKGNSGEAEALLGQPLALVQVDMKMELQGQMQRPPVFAKGTPDQKCRVSDTWFGFRMGEPEHDGDGLVGFYKRDGETLISEFHVCGAKKRDGVCDYLSGENRISLKALEEETDRKEDSWERLLLLMNPNGTVHITGGILPVETIRLPQMAVEKALEKMKYQLFYAPILTPNDLYSFPCPRSKTDEWVFLEPEWKGEWRERKEFTPVEEQDKMREFRGILREGWMVKRRNRMNQILTKMWPPKVKIKEKNELGFFFQNISKDNTLHFLNTDKITIEEYFVKLEEKEAANVDCIEIVFSFGSKDTDIGEFSEIPSFDLHADGWVGGFGRRSDKPYICIPEQDFTVPKLKEFALHLWEFLVPSVVGKTSVAINALFHMEENGEMVRVEEKTVIEIQKQSIYMEIKSFYANMGAVAAGGSNTITWVVSGVSHGTVTDETGKELAQVVEPRGTCAITNIQKTSVYTLSVWSEDGKEKLSRSLKIQVAKPFLREFCIKKNNNRFVFWQVDCSKNLELKGFGSVESIGEKLITDFGEAKMAVLSCKNSERDFISTLWLPDTKIGDGISLFSKTVIDFGSYQLLQVNWKTQGFKKISLTYVDTLRAEYWEFSSGTESGNWEQILAKEDEKVDIQLAVTTQGSEQVIITI